MAFQAETLLQLVLLNTWTVLNDTPASQKQPHFTKYIPNQAVLDKLTSNVSLVFAPGLLDAVQGSTPPTIRYFKTLPTIIKGTPNCWAVYLLVLEKASCRPRIYIGSGTSATEGVKTRLADYRRGTSLPSYVKESIGEGYSIEHIGLLCWIDLPSPGLVLKIRLLFLALEATFAYMFWPMRTVNKANDYGMDRICLWDRSTLEYDGLCSHCCLNEAITGNYEFSEKELEELNAEKMMKRKADEAEYQVEYRAMRIANDPEHIIGAATERMREYRAGDPEKFREQENERRKATVENKEYYCELCKVALDSKYALEKHNGSVKHLKKKEYLAKPHACNLCSWGCDKLGNYNQHLKSVRHLKMEAEAAKAAPAAAQLSSQLD
jgi:hypothetical protein